ncbi:GTPase IMAP family member 8-like [Boleophthalmus pectinirostris]|uniref:GTPase IMAP family member 8-like n=1 Tax=Boleophthalmus pectinirostris TaxID=150288 RepID=UPI00242E3D7B|nr:GTPase IMAP family member 8-like [Boleophthalmus pectinirostris]
MTVEQYRRLVLVGKTGVGKSAVGNTILGRKAFVSKVCSSSVTAECNKAEGERQIAVIDTPGLYDTSLSQEEIVERITKCISMSLPGPHVFVICVQLGRFTKEEKNTVEIIQTVYEATNYTMVLFTRGDDLEDDSTESFINSNKDLSELIQTCHNRYHVFNNKIKDEKQVDTFLDKTEKMLQENGGRKKHEEMEKEIKKTIENQIRQEVFEEMKKSKKWVSREEQETHLKYHKTTTEAGGLKTGDDFNMSGDNTGRRIVLVGKTGVGKSAVGNTILGRKAFVSELSPSSVTAECRKDEETIGGRQIAVIDTPGLYDTNIKKEEIVNRITKCISMSLPGPHVFVICVQLGRFTEEEKNAVKIIQKVFGVEAAKYTIVLFTRGDELGNYSIESFIKANKDLSEFIQTCHNRYHVFNNKIKDEKQVDTFLDKIEKMIQENGGRCYTNEMFKRVEEAIKKEKERRRRLVLVGKTGVGKSAVGNTILGRKAFVSELCPSSVTAECHKDEETIAGRQIAVIDTPGLFDTNFTQEEIVERIIMCISLCAPGPHAFVICVQLGRFTEEEKNTVEIIQKVFGEEAANYTMVLFTRGDDLEDGSIESFIKANKDLSEFIQTCHNRYHVFNNKIKDEKQVDTFLDKIEKMIENNGGRYYTNEMFKLAEEAIKKEEERRLKELEDQEKKKYEEISEEIRAEIRKEAEMSNDFTKGNVMAGAGTGAAVGSVLGPIGAIIGGLIGGAVGGVVKKAVCNTIN